MPHTDKPTSSATKSRAANGRRKAATPEPKARPELFALTIDAATGRIVALERVDDGGERHALSPEERTRLAKAQFGSPLRRLVEQAFEAGIEFVLGDSDDNEPESKADGELSRLLLRSLIERSRIRPLMENESLDAAAVGTLIGHAATNPSTH